MADCAAGAGVTRVWDLGVRVFHWLTVAAVATALVTGLSGPRNLLNIHIAAGAALGGLVAFRILWGLLGSTHVRFSSFPVHFTAINADLAGLFAGRRPRYLGHNPLGSLMALALVAIISLSVMSGVITLGGVDKQGPFAFAVTYVSGKAAQRLHLALAYGLLALIAGHLLGVAYESIQARTNLPLAMITGKKAASATDHAARSAKAKPILAGLCVLILMVGAAYQIMTLSARPALVCRLARSIRPMRKNAGAAIWHIRQVSPRADGGSRSWMVSRIISARTPVSSPASRAAYALT
jgi:cytochrome b